MSADVQTVTTTAPITITPSALVQLKELRADLKVDQDHFLRIGVRGGGCSGFEYQLGFDLPEEDDKQYLVGDETVLMKPGHALYLIGMEVDWATGLNNRGFTFNNPNATETCGCGTSFSA